MPEPSVQQTVAIDALWTDGGLRPRANNLAFLIQKVSDREDLERWKQRLKVWTVRGGLFVLDELYLIQPGSEFSGELEQELDLPSWHQTLVSPKPHLFTPKALANLRQGQLSLADLEEDVDERSFSFLDRQQKRISDAFQEGIDAALRRIDSASSNSSRTEIKGHVIRFSIAYLAARILQDKNFFGSNSIIQPEDPISLLDRMIEITNGFFRRARRSAEYVPEVVRQELAIYMGDRVSFVLTDHRDVGRLYEEAIKKLPRELGSDDWGDLNRHYTPVKLAERMLEALPLERLRPEERFIFDPAAGSGSLLLAATSRLAGMPDIPTGDSSKAYLRSHVAGNDLDRYADLIAQLRYFIASESLGQVSTNSTITDVLPFPEEQNFTHNNYEQLTVQDLPIKPRVIVANPPFAQEGKFQKAAKFVETAVSWLEEGSHFGFILPQTILSGTTQGYPQAREIFNERCQILEVWQLPEGAVGIDADQSVALILGTVGQAKKTFPVISRSVVSRRNINTIREQGFRGKSWLAEFQREQVENINKFWQSVTSFPVSINTSITIPLGNLFYVVNGAKPNTSRISNEFIKLNEDESDTNLKRYWRLGWKGENRLWADPENVPFQERFVRYDKEHFRALREKSEYIFDMPKVLLGADVNRDSSEKLVPRLDTIGFCPNNHVFCIVPRGQAKKFNKGYENVEEPQGWSQLTNEQQRLWLLGVLSSKLLENYSLIGRSTWGITKDNILELPLPKNIDIKLIELTKQIIQRDQARLPIPPFDHLRQELNSLVEASYGTHIVDISSELEQWQLEKKNRTLNVTGQILEVCQEKVHVFLRLSGLLDDNEEEWLPLPQELPGWALDGTVFRAELSEDIETFQELAQRPWALRKFRHTPYPYLNNEELQAKLGRMISLENH
jgi:hypothetical protein